MPIASRGSGFTKDSSTSSDTSIGAIKIKSKPKPLVYDGSKWVTVRELKENKVEVDDPRPPIKQRLGIEGDIAKCPFHKTEKTYINSEEEWQCPFCHETD